MTSRRWENCGRKAGCGGDEKGDVADGGGDCYCGDGCGDAAVPAAWLCGDYDVVAAVVEAVVLLW